MRLRIVALGHKMPAWVTQAYGDYARRLPREFALDLRSVIQEELQSNPTLEELPMEGVSLDHTAPEDNATDRDSDSSGKVGTDTADATPADTSEVKRDEMDFSKDGRYLVPIKVMVQKAEDL